MKLNTQIRLWQLYSFLIPFLSTSVIKMTAFALPRRMWNAYLLFPFSYFLPWLSINFKERKRRVGLVEMSKWGRGWTCALARKEAFLEKGSVLRKLATDLHSGRRNWQEELSCPIVPGRGFLQPQLNGPSIFILLTAMKNGEWKCWVDTSHLISECLIKVSLVGQSRGCKWLMPDFLLLWLDTEIKRKSWRSRGT